MNEKIKIIHDALKTLGFDVVYNNDNDKYLIVGELKGARFTDCWIVDDALAVIERINKNKMVEDYFLYCEKSK